MKRKEKQMGSINFNSKVNFRPVKCIRFFFYFVNALIYRCSWLGQAFGICPEKKIVNIYIFFCTQLSFCRRAVSKCILFFRGILWKIIHVSILTFLSWEDF